MAFLNEQTNELHIKILIAGGTGCGKTTNLQSLYKQTSSEINSRLFDLHDLSQRSYFYEFLPMSLGESKAHSLRLNVYTLPSHNIWESVLLNLAWGIDGLVFVVDSRISALEQNEKQRERLRSLLRCVGKSWDDIPLVFQFNRRDAADALPIKALKSEFSRESAAAIEGVAVQDIGVLETIDAISDRILSQMDVPTFNTSFAALQSGPGKTDTRRAVQ